jgi:hypothetical protein
MRACATLDLHVNICACIYIIFYKRQALLCVFPTMFTTTHRVFHTPELLITICDHSQNRDRIRLARTFRLGFDIAAPQIWKSLESVQPLLMLLAPTVTPGKSSVIIVGLNPHEHRYLVTLLTKIYIAPVGHTSSILP